MKPILFSTNMVQAILEGRKTQTRRLCKFHKAYNIFHNGKQEVESEETIENMLPCKYSIGDILWVRETWVRDYLPLEVFYYKADYKDPNFTKWKPSIFMPREAARIFLKVTNIRVERLQDISESDAIAEGLEFKRFYLSDMITGYKIYGSKDDWDENPIVSYWSLWDKINGKKAWDKNPWVFVYEFEQIKN